MRCCLSGPRDQSYSTGDVWVTVYRGDAFQQGGDVGVAAPTDEVLEKVYATGPLDTVNGNDVVFWVAIHAHYEPRQLAEAARPRVVNTTDVILPL